MATTIEQLVERAGHQELAADQDLLIQDEQEVLAFLSDTMAEIRRRLSQFVPFYYSTRQTLTSNNAASDRFIDLTNLGVGQPLMEAIRKAELAVGGGRIFIVDEDRQGAQPAPRAFLRGSLFYEVGSEWAASSGTVNVVFLYVRQATEIDVDGDYSQTIDLPDEWTRPLVDALSGYIARKDSRPEAARSFFESSAAGIDALGAHLAALHGLTPAPAEPANA